MLAVNWMPGAGLDCGGGCGSNLQQSETAVMSCV